MNLFLREKIFTFHISVFPNCLKEQVLFYDENVQKKRRILPDFSAFLYNLQVGFKALRKWHNTSKNMEKLIGKSVTFLMNP